MKKVILSLLFISILTACSDSDDNGVDGVDLATMLSTGEWVYDNPGEGIWETLRFTPTGIMYYSNKATQEYENFENENVNCRYYITGNDITCTYTLNGVLMYLDFTVTDIKEFEFTAKFNDLGHTFTYLKIIEKHTLEPGETVTCDTRSIAGKANITGFRTHNPSVATVDYSTGEVTAVAAGRTYIEVITDKGTCAVEINVEGAFAYDWDEFLGLTADEIKAEFGTAVLSETEKDIMYETPCDNVDILSFRFDTWSGKVTAVSVFVNEKLPVETVTTYLEGRFYPFEKGSTPTIPAYINKPELASATTGITWNTEQRLVTYVALSKNLWKDYYYMLGRTQEEVINLMKPSVAVKQNDSYLFYGVLDNDYIGAVSFFYTFDFEQISDKCLAVLCNIKDTADTDKMQQYMDSNYIFVESASDENVRYYVTRDEKYIAYIDYEYEQVGYMEYTPESKSRISRMNVRMLPRI